MFLLWRGGGESESESESEPDSVADSDPSGFLTEGPPRGSGHAADLRGDPMD